MCVFLHQSPQLNQLKHQQQPQHTKFLCSRDLEGKGKEHQPKLASMPIVEMCVHMCCSGCESRVRKSLAKLKGIDSVDIDMARQKVTVTGYVEQKKVLKAVRKTGRRAVLWTFPYHPEDHNSAFNQIHYNQNQPMTTTAFMTNPFAHSTASASSYNYRKHGYDESVTHGYYQMPGVAHGYGIVGERAGALFSDENPNACSVM